jgi:O-antigen ligase
MPEVKQPADRLYFWATALLAGFPLWSMRTTVYLIAVWFFVALFDHFRHKEFEAKRNLKWLLLFTALYLVYVLAFLVSPSSAEGMSMLERKFGLLVLPLGFYLYRRRFSEEQLHQIFTVYQLANFALALWLYARLIPMLIEFRHLLTIEGFNYAFRKAVEDIGGIHPTYLSILFLSSVFLQLKWQFEKRYKRGLLQGYSLLHIALLTLLCLLLAARGPLLSAAVAFLAVVFMRNWKSGLQLTALLVSGFLVLIFLFPVVGGRFLEVGKAAEVSAQQSSLTSANIRVSIHHCAVELIEQHWLTGVGFAEVQDQLNACYERYNSKLFDEKDYNTHNQYFDILLSLGFFGILLFTLMLVFPVYWAVIKQNEVYLFFTLFIALCFATENLLSRQYGVVYYAFFNSLLVHFHFNKKEAN